MAQIIILTYLWIAMERCGSIWLYKDINICLVQNFMWCGLMYPCLVTRGVITHQISSCMRAINDNTTRLAAQSTADGTMATEVRYREWVEGRCCIWKSDYFNELKFESCFSIFMISKIFYSNVYSGFFSHTYHTLHGYAIPNWYTTLWCNISWFI